MFFFNDGPYSSMNFATKVRFHLIYLFNIMSDRIQFHIIKGHNLDYLEIIRKLK